MMVMDQLRRTLAWLMLGLAIGAVLALAGCGGGGTTTNSATGSGGGTSTGADANHGALTLGLTGGGLHGVDHVWVQVYKVALHADADQVWSSSDASWTVLSLSTPVAVDLAAVKTSDNSFVAALFSGLKVPAGTYRQLRLFVLPHEGTLSDVATATGLSYNAQVNYTSGGSAYVVPLELPQVDQGWRVTGSFVVAGNQYPYWALHTDLQDSLQRIAGSDGLTHFLMRPRLQRFDMAKGVAIFGQVDAAAVCGNASAPAAPDCADEISVSAQVLSSDGLRHEAVRRYKVDSTGGFALYPLPEASSYDLVITGKHMRTMVVKGVAVEAFDVTSGLGWTVVGDGSAIPLSIESGTPASVSLSSSASPQASSLYWGQTPDASGLPYEVMSTTLNPLDGLPASDVVLPQGSMMVATFQRATSTISGVIEGEALTFQSVPPVEGNGAFGLVTLGTAYDDASATSVLTPPSGSSSVQAPVASRRTGVLNGTLTVTLTGSLSSRYDAVQVIVSDVNGVVDARSYATSPGSVSFSVPAGTVAAAAQGGAVYSVAVRASSMSGNLTWVRGSSVVNLRATTTGSVTLALP